MDLSIIDTFVRTDTASKAASRSSDDAPESFADILDSRLRQPEPTRERPQTAEAREAPEVRPVEAADTRPHETTGAAKPRSKPEADEPVADADASAEAAASPDAEETTTPANKAPANAALVVELLNAGSETPTDGQPTGLEVAATVVAAVTPEQAAANALLALLTDGTASQPEAAAAAASANAGAAKSAATPSTTPTPATNNPDFAAQLNASASETPAVAPAPVVKTQEAPVVTAELAAATPAAAIAASEMVKQPEEASPLGLALDLLEGEGEDTLATVTMGSPTPSNAARPSTAPTTAPGYAAQIASQEPGTDATPTVTPDLSKAASVTVDPDKTAQALDVTVDADKALLASATASTDTIIAPSTADHSVKAAAQTEAAAQRGPRPAAVPVVEQVAVRITKALADGIDRINVKLNPADLGQIDIRMEIGPDGKFNAVFAADRPQTVELLQRDARELARSLQDAGLRADAGSLSFNLRGQNQGQQNSGTLSAFHDGGTAGNGVETQLEGLPMAANIYSSSNAANGRVDIRV